MSPQARLVPTDFGVSGRNCHLVQEQPVPQDIHANAHSAALDTLMDVGTILSQAFSRAWQTTAIGMYDTADRMKR